jgi:hypothetical protein
MLTGQSACSHIPCYSASAANHRHFCTSVSCKYTAQFSSSANDYRPQIQLINRQTCYLKYFSCSITYLLLPQNVHWYRKSCLKSAGKTGSWTVSGFLRSSAQKFRRPVHIPSGNLPVAPTAPLLSHVYNSHYTNQLRTLYATKIKQQ